MNPTTIAASSPPAIAGGVALAIVTFAMTRGSIEGLAAPMTGAKAE